MPLLGAMAGCHVVRFHCWVPLLDAIGGDRLDVVPLGAMVRCDGKMPWWVLLFGAIAACWPLLGGVVRCHLLGTIAGCNRLDVVPW